MKYYGGIDIGGTHIKMGIINEEGKVCLSKNEETAKEREALMQQVKDFLLKHSDYSIQAVGISTPGIVRTDGYMQTSGAIKCFFHRNMKKEFEEYLNLPVVIENDGKAAACAEKWQGAAKDIDNFVCLTLGTAIGGAIYIHGKLYRGFGGLAGEFGISLAGHQKGHYDEQSFSYHAATVAGLCRHYSYRVHERVLDAQEIMIRAKQGDTIAEECLKEFYHSVAVLLMNIAVTIAPEVILIGGGISSNGDVMKNIIADYQQICQDYHVLSLVNMPRIQTCYLHNQAGMIGAVAPFMKDVRM